MTDAIETHLTSARQAAAEGRAGDARNSYARAAALSREGRAPLLQAHALRHLSDLDRQADHLEQALAHAEQAAALYRANAQGTSPDTGQARDAWSAARELYALAGVADGVAECERRLDAD